MHLQPNKTGSIWTIFCGKTEMDARRKTDGTWVNMHNDDNLLCCTFAVITWK